MNPRLWTLAIALFATSAQAKSFCDFDRGKVGYTNEESMHLVQSMKAMIEGNGGYGFDRAPGFASIKDHKTLSDGTEATVYEWKRTPYVTVTCREAFSPTARAMQSSVGDIYCVCEDTRPAPKNILERMERSLGIDRDPETAAPAL